MDIEALRVEMLGCKKDCRVGIMITKGVAYLSWVVGSNMHGEIINKTDCVIGSDKLNETLAHAKEYLIV